jgi:hypothetical protein
MLGNGNGVFLFVGSEIILCYAVARRHNCWVWGGSDMRWRSTDGKIKQPLSLTSHTVL